MNDDKTISIALNSEGKPLGYVARITGKSEKYGLSREFVTSDGERGSDVVWNIEHFSDGVYEIKGDKRTFIQVTGGDYSVMTQRDYVEIAAVAEDLQSRRSPPKFVPLPEEEHEVSIEKSPNRRDRGAECYECGAWYNDPSKVDSDGMGCVRCN